MTAKKEEAVQDLETLVPLQPNNEGQETFNRYITDLAVAWL